ncbi:MAG TPA: sigma-70 family RNA polymerase sigma factor, partial [Alphaproteobacteria bacterium]|nr:sigma-70 family RNA polymerase sigma factor [Alphaproteobacteria bacterium]
MRQATRQSIAPDTLNAEIPHLRRYASALSGDRDQADDLVQDCLVRAISRLDRYEPGTNLRSWLFTIMKNGHIDHIRKQQRRGHEVEVQP